MRPRLCVAVQTRKAAAVSVVALSAVATAPASAGSFELWGMDAETQLQATYAAAVRLHDADQRIIATAPSQKIPLPDYLKLPESNNYDDGDRNFDKGSLVNNRLTLLGELLLMRDDYGLLLRGDAFYDDVYHRRNDNDSPETINTTQQPVDSFTRAARRFDGGRARLLDAYVYGNWTIGDDDQALSLRLGRQVVAWGESLFFSGISLAQGPADATKAAVPGADVKSLLLPVNQLSVNFQLTSDITLLGQYKLEYKETELNPVGEFFSVADIVGPGREFIYGIENPLFLSNLSDLDLLSDDVPEALELVGRLLAPNLPLSGLTSAIGGILANLDPLLPDVNLPVGAIPQPGTPKNINVQYAGEQRPSAFGQYGVGIKYQLASDTSVGLFHLRYHNTTPAPVQSYGFATLLPGRGALPPVTTELLGLQVPVTYKIRYFDGIRMSAASLSTQLFGANIGAEAIYRDGVDILVDVDGGILGPVPTPTRGRMSQFDLNGLYTIGPRWFWDTFTIVADLGYDHIIDVDPVSGPDPAKSFTNLTYTRDASAFSTLLIIEKRNIFDGWDLTVPLTYSIAISGHTSFLSGFGSLMGEGDQRAGASVNFTRLAKLTLGLNYSGFFGTPDFREHPYADRDNAGVTVTYRF